MAKMTFEFDTIEKTFSASIDGAAVPGAVGAEVYPNWDDDKTFTCTVIARKQDEASGITEIRRLLAGEKDKAGAVKRGVASDSPFKDFVLTVDAQNDKFRSDVAKFFGAQA